MGNEPITYKKGAAFLGAGFTIKPLYDDYIGVLRAIDPSSGKIMWEVKNEAPLWGGVPATGGGLVFWGTPEGYLKAADARTGQVLWQFQTGSGVVAPAVTWEVDGSQYIAVMSGWGGAVPLWGGDVAKKVSMLEQGGSVWVFKLSSDQQAVPRWDEDLAPVTADRGGCVRVTMAASPHSRLQGCTVIGPKAVQAQTSRAD